MGLGLRADIPGSGRLFDPFQRTKKELVYMNRIRTNTGNQGNRLIHGFLYSAQVVFVRPGNRGAHAIATSCKVMHP